MRRIALKYVLKGLIQRKYAAFRLLQLNFFADFSRCAYVQAPIDSNSNTVPSFLLLPMTPAGVAVWGPHRNPSRSNMQFFNFEPLRGRILKSCFYKNCSPCKSNLNIFGKIGKKMIYKLSMAIFAHLEHVTIQFEPGQLSRSNFRVLVDFFQ